MAMNAEDISNNRLPVVETEDEIQVKHCLIINMDSRTDLWEALNEPRRLMQEAGIRVERVPGVDNTYAPNLLKTLYREGILAFDSAGWRRNSKHLRNELGCFTAHYNALKRVVQEGWESCLIMEDGVEFLRADFENLRTNKQIDVKVIHPHMKNEGWGAQGYVVTEKGAANMLSILYPLKLPYDLAMRNALMRRELVYHIHGPYFMKRNDRRISSIGRDMSERDLNKKQSLLPLYKRLLDGLMEDPNIDLDDYLFDA